MLVKDKTLLLHFMTIIRVPAFVKKKVALDVKVFLKTS